MNQNEHINVGAYPSALLLLVAFAYTLMLIEVPWGIQEYGYFLSSVVPMLVVSVGSALAPADW